MGFKYHVREHARKGMMVQMLQDGILKLNHLLPNEMFKRKKTPELGVVESRKLP
jgi:hypothetical protein